VSTKEHLVRLPANIGIIWSLALAGDRVYVAGDGGLARAWDTKTWQPVRTYDATEGSAARSLTLSDDGKMLVIGHDSGAIVVWDAASGKTRWRTGGRSRDHGSCDDLSTQTWVNDAHRASVAAACTSEARAYFDEYARSSHQRLDNDVDVKTSWSDH
jgi:WD40 repeat protein